MLGQISFCIKNKDVNMLGFPSFQMVFLNMEEFRNNFTHLFFS